MISVLKLDQNIMKTYHNAKNIGIWDKVVKILICKKPSTYIYVDTHPHAREKYYVTVSNDQKILDSPTQFICTLQRRRPMYGNM